MKRRLEATIRGCGLVLALVLATAGRGLGQTTAGEYQVYGLKHKPAVEVEKILSEMLSQAGLTAHLVADARANQILLRGPEKAQQIARELIASLDRPAPAAPPPRPIARLYPMDEERLARAAERIRSAYADRPGEVAVTIDSQGRQLVVLAPPAVHEQVPRLVAAAADASRSRPSDAPRQTDLTPAEQFVPVARAPVDQVEAQLKEMYGSRLTVPSADRTSGRAEYRFVDLRGRRVDLIADRPRNGFLLVGSGSLVTQFARLIRAIDGAGQAEGTSVRVVPVRRASPSKVRQAFDAYRSLPPDESPPRRPDDPAPIRSHRPGESDQGNSLPENGLRLASYLFQPADAGAGAAPPPAAPGAPAAPPGPAKPMPGEAIKPSPRPVTPEEEEEFRRRLRALGTDVEIEILPDLDAIILRGRERDIKDLQRIIEEIERLSAATEPAIDIYYLRHASGESVSAILRQVNEDYLGGRPGRVTIMPLGKPNALLLIGWGDAVRAAKELIAKLDQPVAPQTQQRIFHLRHAPATAVATTITQFFSTRATAMGPRVEVTPDPRTNSLLVHAAPRDMAEVELLIERLDTVQTDAVLQTRIFKLLNTLAADVAGTLQAALDAARGGAAAQRSAALELLAVDPKGERLVKSGLLNDVRVTADPRLNVVIVHAPAESMDLLAALIRQLDTPGAAAQIKVFRIVNGDANAVATMLRSLVPTGGTAGPPLAAAEGESSLVPMRFSVDSRTNSIIAVGSAGDLRIIEALIVRLDEQDVQQRQTAVYRLKNAPANDVATAINDFLRSQRLLQQAAPGALSPFQQLESEVVVVPEPVSNALILSATPRFFQEIADLVEKLDAQPPQVMIQVLIAEVALNNNDEFGVEFGLQDSLLFDRSLLSGNLTTVTNTIQQSTPAGIITSTTQTTPFATLNPGFNFNNEPLGNAASTQALARSANVGTQGLTTFNLGRVNNELGFGGLVLSASSESVSVLIRALQSTRRLEVLSRPQIMTLDNQPAFIQIGQRVPRISSTGIVSTGQFNAIELVNVGLILGVTPRISPEGMVVMEIDAENSSLGAISEGIPVSVSNGEIIRSPTFNTTMAQTTVSAADGETIVLGGLISKGRTRLDRRVPYLADIPVLGNLFQYHNISEKRSELLIVLTPHVVRTPEEAERLKRQESARMTWCLGDIQEIHGDAGLTRSGGAPDVIYPDVTPRGTPPARSGWEKISPQGAAPPADGNEAPTPAPRGPGRFPPAAPEPIRPGETPGPLGPQGAAAHPPLAIAPAADRQAGPMIGNPLRPADRPPVPMAQQIPTYEPYAER